MDEIICPECGRPNLGEAEKCWYCQVVLIKDNNGSKAPEILQDFQAKDTIWNSKPEETPDENVPDWLKRVRELRKADQPEEEINQWQQEKLFTGQAEEEPRPDKRPETPRKPVQKPDQPDPKSAELVDQPAFEPISDPEHQVIMDKDKDESHEEDTDLSEGELPEGFLPLNN